MNRLDPELAVIGSIFCSDEASSYAIYQVPEDHFLDSKNRILFGALKRIHRQGIPIDITTAYGYLTETEKLNIPFEFLVHTTEAVTHSKNIRHYADLLRKNAINFRLDRCFESLRITPESKEIQAEIRRLWDQMDVKGESVSHLKDSMIGYLEKLEARTKGSIKRFKTGFEQIDNYVGGFDLGNLVTIGARPSVGKSAVLLNIALNLLKDKKKVMFVSAEMLWDEILDRMMSMETGIPISQLRAGKLGGKFPKITNTAGSFSELPFSLLEGGKMSMGRIRLALESVCPDVLMVDFIQRFNPPDGRVNRAAFYSDLANEFKEIALNRKIVVFVASQFSRDIEKQDDREPLLSDLKESGGIEEASDKVFLLKARPDNPMSPTRGLKIYLKKNRQGPTGIFYFKFEKSKTKFHESTEADYDTGAEVGTVGSDEENSRGMEGKMAASGETWNFL